MSKFLSPLQKRLQRKLEEKGLDFSERTMRVIQNAFVTAVREEVEERYKVGDGEGRQIGISLLARPLVIAGLGSFKMRMRPKRWFCNPGNHKGEPIEKAPAHRLAFTAKWEEIK